MEQKNSYDSKKCPHCSKIFFDSSTKNRHIKKVHQQSIQQQQGAREARVICPLCREENMVCGDYKSLQVHLEVTHSVVVEEFVLTFCSKGDFEKWLREEKIDVNYALSRTKKHVGHTVIHYFCNRSNASGRESKCTIRTVKSGGSIKIHGVCPSRLIVKIYETGQTHVTFYKTHVGHEEEIRSQHLSKSEKDVILAKLESGVTVNRILQDARKIECGSLRRINMLNRQDIAYLSRKNNVRNRKHNNSMIAVALKVQEWNENGKNYAFFFKAQGKPMLKLICIFQCYK